MISDGRTTSSSILMVASHYLHSPVTIFSLSHRTVMAGLSVSKSASFRKANSVAPTFPTNSATPNPTIMNTTTQQVRSQIRKRHVPDYLDQPAPEDEMREMTYDIILDEVRHMNCK